MNHKKFLKSLLNPAQTESKNSFNEAYEMDDLEGLLKPQKRTRTTEGLAVLLTVKYLEILPGVTIIKQTFQSFL